MQIFIVYAHTCDLIVACSNYHSNFIRLLSSVEKTARSRVLKFAQPRENRVYEEQKTREKVAQGRVIRARLNVSILKINNAFPRDGSVFLTLRNSAVVTGKLAYRPRRLYINRKMSPRNVNGLPSTYPTRKRNIPFY